ncbi:hypothetical protein B5807_02023 [Epicoccum nigrum]|uniref:Uncharacterized protein n=1 Tax=Epicoccum nigrum TaxID=105696 RepID=A0A1Y2MAN4_EPING|nr:hypothetical protein B5807_02023 [Epicoccum nigrum]
MTPMKARSLRSAATPSTPHTPHFTLTFSAPSAVWKRRSRRLFALRGFCWKKAKKYLHSIVSLSRSKAGKPKSFDFHVDEDGNISFPRARTGAWDRVRELELFRDAENAWNELFPFEKLEGPLRVRVVEAWGHDATIALTHWDKEHLEAISGSVTKQDENASRK